MFHAVLICKYLNMLDIGSKFGVWNGHILRGFFYFILTSFIDYWFGSGVAVNVH